MDSANPRRDLINTRSQRLLEFSVVLLLGVTTLWQLSPGLHDSMKLAHETVLKQCASALRDSVHFAQLQQHAHATSHSPRLQALLLAKRTATLTKSDCLVLWRALLGDAAPQASEQAGEPFLIGLKSDERQQSGCHFRYTLAGNMFIDYFPKSDVVIVDDVY